MATLITGNTYPVKDALKSLGGRWDPTAKGWKVPDDRADEARALVGGVQALARCLEQMPPAKRPTTTHLPKWLLDRLSEDTKPRPISRIGPKRPPERPPDPRPEPTGLTPAAIEAAAFVRRLGVGR